MNKITVEGKCDCGKQVTFTDVRYIEDRSLCISKEETGFITPHSGVCPECKQLINFPIGSTYLSKFELEGAKEELPQMPITIEYKNDT